MSVSATQDIRGVLISVSGGKLLLPNASVAEVITYSDPEPVPNAPGWLLGRVRWRGWALPIVSYSRMVGWSLEAAALGAKVAVLKGVGNHARMPYFAVLTQGFPRLVTIVEDELIQSSTHDASLTDGVYATALFHQDEVVVPDLSQVEQKIVDVLQSAAAAATAAT